MRNACLSGLYHVRAHECVLGPICVFLCICVFRVRVCSHGVYIVCMCVRVRATPPPPPVLAKMGN